MPKSIDWENKSNFVVIEYSTSASVHATAMAGKRVNDSCNGKISLAGFVSELP